MVCISMDRREFDRPHYTSRRRCFITNGTFHPWTATLLIDSEYFQSPPLLLYYYYYYYYYYYDDDDQYQALLL